MGAVTVIMQMIFIIGLIIIIIDVVKAYNKCPPQKIIYRYVPRTFLEDQENPVPLDDIFYTMFNNPTPWVASVDVERKKNDIGENLNRYYVTQI
uniref:Uncharacterized protein n=1 Tax=viral metagenome TaxID=1070528 RepID=A0A6C0LTS3_9ZZZZ